jgi:hypothetical protein
LSRQLKISSPLVGDFLWLEKRIQAQLRAGKGMLKVARECGVGSGTVQRVKQEMEGTFAGVAA